MGGLEDRLLILIKELEEEKRLADKRAKQLFDLASGGNGAGIPVGAIVPYLGGYFTDGINGGFTMVMAAANTVAAVNTLLNPDGFYVCNGAELILGPGSPIFEGPGKYLPLLTDDRFIMGDTLGGARGGNSAMAHTHPSGTLGTDTEANHGHGDNFSVSSHTLTAAQMPQHRHTIYSWMEAGAGAARREVFTSSGDANTNTAYTGSSQGHSHGLGGGVSAGGSHSHTVNSGATGAASVTENRPRFLGCFYIMRVV